MSDTDIKIPFAPEDEPEARRLLDKIFAEAEAGDRADDFELVVEETSAALWGELAVVVRALPKEVQAEARRALDQGTRRAIVQARALADDAAALEARRSTRRASRQDLLEVGP